jgi:EAL domain-containing protein (putative c-di-GMP-specific phosphodiesterase class I)
VLQTVGEHVETREQADMLRLLGVDFGQGYLFGRAEPLDDAIEGLRERGTTTVRRILDAAG